jgi:hypothetical protein
MEDELYFNTLVTKSLHPIDSGERFFEGYLTVQVKDKQGEITIVDELIKVLPVWMDRGAPISDTHSNRIIGRGINYSQVTYKDKSGEEYPAIKITGKIHKDYQLDHDIWNKIKSGEYKGLSFGGATKADRTPKVMKDGSIAYELKSLEHYEVAVCRDPAVPLALITDHNPLAKSMNSNYHMRDDKMVVQCTKWGCTVEKGMDHSNSDGDSNVEMYNQDVDPDKSSGRKGEPIDDESHVEDKKKDGDQYFGGVRHSGKEYDTGSTDTAQVTTVNDEETKDKEEDKKEGEMNEIYDSKKSGIQTEAGNNQLGAPSRGDSDTYKNDENYIKVEKDESDKDMEDKESDKELKDDKEEKSSEDDKKTEEVDKSFQETIKSNIDILTDVIKSLAETQKDVSGSLENINSRLKALETPTDLPLKPATSASDDVGAKVIVPDTYQSNSVQAGLDDDKSGEDKPKDDKSGLKMQEKSANFDFTTETPRPNAAIDAVNKGTSDISLLLKDARDGGDLSVVALNILSGKYYTPSPEEIGSY